MRDLAERDLHALPVGELDADALAALDIVLRDLHAALGDAAPAHAVREPRGAEPDLRRFKPVALAHQHALERNFQAVEFQLAMAAVLLRPHDRDAALDAPTGLVLVEQESGETAARIVRGARHQDEMCG